MAANTDYASVFGRGGDDAAPAAPELDADLEALPEAESELANSDEVEGDAMPPDFAVHVLEAFPDMEDPQIDALYRAIKSCHGGL